MMDTDDTGLRNRRGDDECQQEQQQQEEAPSAASASSSAKSEAKAEHQDSRFECNICLDTATDAVISMCGHLFCWPCLHQWLETRPTRQLCPVCKSAISREKVIPVYGRSGEQTDPREKVPPRPQGQRSEAQAGFPGFNWGNGGDGGFQFSFGIGAFPFTFFASTLNFGDRRPAPPAPGSAQYQEEQTISKVFIWIAVLFILWLLLA